MMNWKISLVLLVNFFVFFCSAASAHQITAEEILDLAKIADTAGTKLSDMEACGAPQQSNLIRAELGHMADVCGTTSGIKASIMSTFARSHDAETNRLKHIPIACGPSQTQSFEALRAAIDAVVDSCIKKP